MHAGVFLAAMLCLTAPYTRGPLYACTVKFIFNLVPRNKSIPTWAFALVWATPEAAHNAVSNTVAKKRHCAPQFSLWPLRGVKSLTFNFTRPLRMKNMGQRLCQRTVPRAPDCSSASSPFSLFSLFTKRLFIPTAIRHVTTWRYCEIDGVRVALSYTGMHREWKQYRGVCVHFFFVVCVCA